MEDNNIQTWIGKARKAGLSDSEVKEQLKATGWDEKKINQLLSPTPPPPPGKKLFHLGKTPGLSKKFTKKKIWIITTLVIIALLIGGGVFAYLKGYLPIPFLSKDAKSLLIKSFSELAKAGGGEFGLNIHIFTEERTADAKPIEMKNTSSETSSAELKAKDSTTYSGASQLRTALVLYSDDNQASYPDSLGKLSPNYISKIPKQGDDNSYEYTASKDKKGFTLKFTYLGSENAGSQQLTEASKEIPAPSYDESSNITAALSQNLINNSMVMIPSDLNLQGQISVFTSINRDAPKQSKGIFKLNGSYSSGGTIFNADAEMRLKDGKAYIQIKQFPTLFFFDVSAFENKWIVFDPETKNTSLSLFDLKDMTDRLPDKDSTAKLQTEISHAARIAFEKGVIIAENDGRETLNGHPTHRIRITIDPEKLSDFAQAYRSDAWNRGADIKNVEGLLKRLEDPKFIEQAKEHLKNTTLTAWVGQSDSKPRKFEFSLVVVPPDRLEKLKNRQFRLNFGLTFDHLGEEPKVDIPKDTISLDEAERLLTGKTVEEQQFDKQRTAINNIRSALSYYNRVNEKFPTNLDKLLEPPSTDNTNTNTSVDSTIDNYFYGNRKSIPKDIYTGKSFEYKTGEDDYTLIYTIKLPEEDSGGLFGNNDYYKDRYVDGLNTATKDFLSLEKAQQKDSDNDGLSDADEKKYGTNIYKSDTDGDGYTDKEEIDNGYDPLTNYGSFSLGILDNGQFTEKTSFLNETLVLQKTRGTFAGDYKATIVNTATNETYNTPIKIHGTKNKTEWPLANLGQKLGSGSYKMSLYDDKTLVVELNFTIE